MTGRPRYGIAAALLLACSALPIASQRPTPDVVPTPDGPITIQPIAHASLAIRFGTELILIDPARFGPGLPDAPKPSELSEAEMARAKAALRKGPADTPLGLVTAFVLRPGEMDRFSGLVPAAIILVTDIHTDHLDPSVLEAVMTSGTRLIVPPAARDRLLGVQGAEFIANGERRVIRGVTIDAVPMYNTRADPKLGVTFHERGRGNGYVLTIAGKRIYVAGDTACTPEMKSLSRVDVAFLPMNLPYTMTPSEAAECARAFKPAIVYPYHYFESDLEAFRAGLNGTGIEIRTRDWYLGR